MLKKELVAKNKKVLIAHYAGLVKYSAKEFWGWDGKKDKKGRTLLQEIGTEIVRANNPTFWIDYIMNMTIFSQGIWDYIIIPDTRFPNEIDSWKKLESDYIHFLGESFCTTNSIRVTRFTDNELTKEQLNHSSETALDNYNFDFYIDNNGTLNDLKPQIKEVLTKVNL